MIIELKKPRMETLRLLVVTAVSSRQRPPLFRSPGPSLPSPADCHPWLLAEWRLRRGFRLGRLVTGSGRSDPHFWDGSGG